MIDFSKNNHEELVECAYCKVIYSIRCDRDDIKNWLNGEGYIQDLLHYLTPAERELLLSKTCDNCWTRMFGDDDEEEDD